jgi:hypothetical protein
MIDFNLGMIGQGRALGLSWREQGNALIDPCSRV